jgi:cardiolipin synthase
MTLANVFTIARLIMIPIFGYLWYRGDALQALWVFVVAAITDILDGLIARSFRQTSRLGAILDPAADKLLLLVSYIVAGVTHAVPVWLAVLVIGRDVVLALGAAMFAWVIKGRHDPAQWHPSRIGKYTMFCQSILVALLLFNGVFRRTVLGAWMPVTMFIVATVTLASGAQYVGIGVRALVCAPRDLDGPAPAAAGPEELGD